MSHQRVARTGTQRQHDDWDAVHEQMIEVQQQKIQRKSLTTEPVPAITGNEKDGDISPGTEWVFSVNGEKKEWILSTTYIKNKYKTAHYLPDQYIEKDWFEYWVNGGIEFQTIFITAAARNNIDPIELFTVAAGEGLLMSIDLFGYKYDQEVSGPGDLGLDFFTDPSTYPKLEKYLPKDYNEGDEFTKYDFERNEAGGKMTTPSAKFKNLQSGIDGLSAFYAYVRDQIVEYGTALGYKEPTADEKQFWSYYAFQSLTKAKTALKAAKGWDYSYFYTSKNKYYVIDQTENNHPSNIPSKALKRVASTKYIKIRTKAITNVN